MRAPAAVDHAFTSRDVSSWAACCNTVTVFYSLSHSQCDTFNTCRPSCVCVCLSLFLCLCAPVPVSLMPWLQRHSFVLSEPSPEIMKVTLT